MERGKGDKIFINTSGIGKVHPNADIKMSNVKVGDQIIVSNEIAAHGVSILSVRQGLEFETEIVSDTRNLNDAVKELLDLYGTNIHLMRDPTRGGVASVLNEIAKDANVGIDLEESKIPIDQQVGGACELLGLDPLYIANEGVFIAIVDPCIAEQVVQTLSSNDKTKSASIIGEIVEDHTGKVILKSKIGGRRVVNMLPGEQLPRIC